MGEDHCTLGFGVTYDMVAVQTACGQLLTLTSHRGDDRTPPHKHVNDYICIVLNGGFAEQECNQWRERHGGTYFMHHAGETHHDRFGPNGATCLNLHFAAAQPSSVFEGACPTAARIAADKLAFELAGAFREELVMASLAAEILGDLQPNKGQRPVGGRWIDQIVEALWTEPARRWSLRELAAIADRHPVHVAQAFRAKTGISLGGFQRRRRLTNLSLALQRGTTPLAMLADEFGYCDQSHMTTEFRAAFGISPGRYRRDFH